MPAFQHSEEHLTAKIGGEKSDLTANKPA